MKSNKENKIYTSNDDLLILLKPLINEKIIIDMGCGHGDYMLEHCPKDKLINWIGIDISCKRAKKTLKRLVNENNQNFIIFADDGQKILLNLPDNCIDTIHINFPDPWLKDRQWKNRLFRPSFVIDMIRVLKPQGQLYFVTDIKEYANSVARILSLFPQWKSQYTPIVQENLFENFPTLFYKKMSLLRPISYLSFYNIS